MPFLIARTVGRTLHRVVTLFEVLPSGAGVPQLFPKYSLKGVLMRSRWSKCQGPRWPVRAGERPLAHTTSDPSLALVADKGSQVQILSARLRIRL